MRAAVMAFLFVGCGGGDDSGGATESGTTSEPYVPGPGPYDLRITGADLADLTDVFVVVLKAGEVEAEAEVQVSDGGFAMALGSLLEKGASYDVHILLDLDDSGYCEEDRDSAWVTAIPAVEQAVEITIDPSTPEDMTACPSFAPPTHHDLTFGGAGFTVAADGTVHVSIIDQDGGTQVMLDSGPVDAQGNFAFAWPLLAEHEHTYTVDWYVDLDADGTCDVGVDQMWTQEVGPVGGSAVVGALYDAYALNPAACTAF